MVCTDPEDLWLMHTVKVLHAVQAYQVITSKSERFWSIYKGSRVQEPWTLLKRVTRFQTETLRPARTWLKHPGLGLYVQPGQGLYVLLGLELYVHPGLGCMSILDWVWKRARDWSVTSKSKRWLKFKMAHFVEQQKHRGYIRHLCRATRRRNLTWAIVHNT